MGTIKDRNFMDLTESEDIKKRWQEYTEELYKKDLHDPDNHDGELLNCRHLHTIYMFATWKNMSWRARFWDRLFTVMFKLVLEKAEEPEIKLPTSTGS